MIKTTYMLTATAITMCIAAPLAVSAQAIVPAPITGGNASANVSVNASVNSADNAALIAKLQALVKLFTQLLAAMQAAKLHPANASSSTISPTSTQFTRNLALGSRGDDVMKLQT